MHVLSITCVLFCVACSCLAKPYQYSYYISSPTSYQTVEVSDGGVSANGAQFPARSNGPANPAFRQGRGGFGNNQNPYPAGRYPIDQNESNFRRGWGPNYRDIPDRGFDPLFNQGSQGPEGRARGDPHSYDPYDRDFNYRFNLVDPNQRRPSFQQDNFNYNSRYPQGLANNPEYRNNFTPLNPQYAALNHRSALKQEIDETNNMDKEEVTTSQPCSFCGVDRVNPRDGINDNNADPDSEPVEPKKVGGKTIPQFLVENSVVTPASVIIPYYILT